MKKTRIMLMAACFMMGLTACGKGGSDIGGNASDSMGGSEAVGNSVLASLEPINLAYAHNGSENAMVGRWGYLLKEKIEAASDGKISVTIYSNGEMGTDAETIEAVLDDTIQIVAMQPSPAVAFVPELAVFDLPCVFANSEAEKINQVLNDSAFADIINENFQKAGLKCLGFSQGATFRQFTSSEKVNSIEDFKGRNIRVMDNQYQIALWKLLGCNTTPIPGSELYMSLQNGLVDSQENALDTCVSMSAWEVQNYVTLTNHSLYTNMIVMSKSYFESLPEEYRSIINNAIAESITEMIPWYQEGDQTAYKTLEDNGMEFTELTKEQLDEIVELAQPLYNEIRSDVGEELVDTLIEAVR